MDTAEHIRALTEWVGALVDELARGGVTQFVVCPGSRSTPLALAAARHPLVRIWMLLDERSAGFFALGMARELGGPVALLCTSGTAAANFLPAVAEADLARVPLIVLTADRPHELRDNGAPQTIDQVRIFGTTTRWASDLPEPAGAPGEESYVRAVAARAIAASRGLAAGPVHLNLPFREPLVPDREQLLALFKPKGAAQQSSGATVSVGGGRRILDADQIAGLAARLGTARRGLILAGPGCPPDLAAPLADLAGRLGFPILADPLSGLRHGPHDRALVLSAYDAFLRDAGFVARHGPELVLRFGAMPTSKPVLQFLQRHTGAHAIVVDGGAGWREPTSLAAEHIFADEIWLCQALAETVGPGTSAQPETLWSREWLLAEQATREAIERELRRSERISEPRAMAELADLLPAGALLMAANSMPIRDIDTFLPGGERALRIVGNRGANGIDGLVSTALGAAAAGAGPVALAIGDLALYHDSNGLLAAKLHGLNLTIVLVNNDGGGIFSFLPQADEQDQFEALFGTPHGLDFRPLAELYGARYTRAESWETFRAAVSAGLAGTGLHIVELRTERAQNVADHRAIWPAVSAALRDAGLS